MKLILRRERSQPSHACTLGLLFVVGTDLSLVTIERPWIPADHPDRDIGGKKGLSCVPLGSYRLERHDTPDHPKTWALVNFELDVVHQQGDDHDPDEDRETCLLHSANYVTEIEGCIAPGTYTETAPANLGGYCVRESRVAMAKLRGVLPWTDDHILEIVEAT